MEDFDLDPGEHVVISGAPGTGKTAWIYHFLNVFPRDTVMKAIVINTIGLHGFEQKTVSDYVFDEPAEINFRGDDSRDFYATSEHLRRVLQQEDEADANGRIVKRAPRVICWTQEAVQIMHRLDEDERLADRIGDYFTAIYDCCVRYAFERKNVILVVDELPYFCDNKAVSNWQSTIMRAGRNYNVTTVSATQRFQDVHKLFSDHTTHWILFPVSKRMIVALGAKVPHIQATRILKPYHWLWVNNAKQERCIVMPPVPLVYDDRPENASR